MSFTKFLPVALIVAALAFIWMFVSARLELLPWVAFITWAGYFLSGMDIKGGIHLVISFTLGVIFGMAIVAVGTQLGPSLGEWAFPVVVAVAAFMILLLELVPWFDLAPGYFLGAAAFFAAGATADWATFRVVMIPGLLGLALGFVTAYLRGVVFKLEGVEDPLKKEKKEAGDE